MRHILYFLAVCCLIPLIGMPAGARDLPIFDAHIHYNQPDWSAYTPEAILALFDVAGVRWAIVSSTPDEGTVRVHEKAPARIVPVLRPYRTPADVGSWTTDATLIPYMEARLKRGIYRGLGEFHLSASQAEDPVVKAFALLGERYGWVPQSVPAALLDREEWLREQFAEGRKLEAAIVRNLGRMGFDG
jgi:hypothetical protein